MTVRTDFISSASAALRPLAVAAGIVAAAAALPALAHADSPNDPFTGALNGAGVANNGSVSDALAGVGKSICPSLVKPGATLASITSQLSGNSGLSPTIAGMVASMAIQMECPAAMTSLAHGNMPFPMGVPGMGVPGMGVPGMGVPGAQPFVPSMFPLAGANPAPPNPLTALGH